MLRIVAETAPATRRVIMQAMTPDLFDSVDEEATRTPSCEPLGPGAVLLRAAALREAEVLLADVDAVLAAAPLRHLVTPGGYSMSVAMSNCGHLGWVSDPRGYRYDTLDPASNRPWPAMPASFERLAREAAAQAGFEAFRPDACLINRYEPGARLSLHQDRDERDLRQPIVSVSLGLPAVFQFGGLKRGDPIVRLPLQHGDVVVWGGPARLRYHGVLAVKPGHHRLTGGCRVNLTFRAAA